MYRCVLFLLLLSPVAAEAQTDLAVTVTASAPIPLVGRPTTWTAHVTGAQGSLLYRFWRFDPSSTILFPGWNIARDWSPSPVYTWTPVRGDVGPHVIQVWVLPVGSAKSYEAWASTGFFDVKLPSQLELKSTGLEPIVGVGMLVAWQALVDLDSADVEYQFWRFSPSGWQLAQPYSPQSIYQWRADPADVGFGAVQAWVRRAGDSVAYEQWTGAIYEVRSSSPVSQPLAIHAEPLPGTAGVPITFSALTNPGADPLEYQFWRRDAAGWILAQDYSLTPTYTWNTDTADAGGHAVQAWVRRAGSAFPYEGWASTGFFDVQCPADRVGLTFENFFAHSGVRVQFLAEATGQVTAVPCSTDFPLEYQFWSMWLGTPHMIRDFDSSPQLDWTLVSPIHRQYLSVHARRQGTLLPVGTSPPYEVVIESQSTAVELTIDAEALTAPPGAILTLMVRVRNIGFSALPAGAIVTIPGFNLPGLVPLAELPVGESVLVPVPVRMPTEPGAYQLKPSLALVNAFVPQPSAIWARVVW